MSIFIILRISVMRLFLGLKDFYGVVVVQLYVEGWGLRQTEFRAGFVP